jgi:PAS domain-containing protein
MPNLTDKNKWGRMMNTDDHQRREALHEAETRFRTAFEDAPIGMGLSTLEGRWLLVLGLYDLVFGLLAFAVFDFLLEE